MITISSVNSQQIFIKFTFPESTWNCPGLGWKKIRKNPDSGKKTGLLCLFPTFGLQFSTNFYRFWFSRVLRSPRITWCKKFRKNPDSGENPDSIFFRIFSKMDSLRYFVIIKCFSFFEIPIFKATVAILLFGCKILKSPRRTTRGRSAHVRELLKL